MGFASEWLEKRAVYPKFINEQPEENTGIIIVIPAYNEAGIIFTLDSLSGCSRPSCKTEVFVVINAPEGAPAEHIANNKQSVKEIGSWKKQNSGCFFRLYCFEAEPAVKGWGVGLARKTGMDEALRRFDTINNPEGVILCLDADCTVDRDYFIAVENQLLRRKDRKACSIFFEHPLSGVQFPDSNYQFIASYELHLRYMFQGLKFSGFPYVFHTVGSAMAVKAIEYMKAGGMNRRQAGEDFYFIQKLLPMGGYFSLNETTVFPSPRTSYRVPFGTGASMEKLLSGTGNLLTYNFKAYQDLREIFTMIINFSGSDRQELELLYSKLPERVRLFTDEEEWTQKLMEIQENTSNADSFRKRFFEWFNMFKVIKYLNFIHHEKLARLPVEISALQLLKETGQYHDYISTQELLLFYRSLEKI
jgi:glycosyltransferase involved in cell wall biosynthesis